jgi:hypothetical protein
MRCAPVGYRTAGHRSGENYLYVLFKGARSAPGTGWPSILEAPARAARGPGRHGYCPSPGRRGLGNPRRRASAAFL